MVTKVYLPSGNPRDIIPSYSVLVMCHVDIQARLVHLVCAINGTIERILWIVVVFTNVGTKSFEGF